MKTYLRTYQAFLYGLLLFLSIAGGLLYTDVIYIDPSEVLANMLGFLIGWLIISLPIHYFPFLRKHKVVSFKVIALGILLAGILVNNMNAQITNNPITVVGLVFIGLSFFSMLAPSYFKKHAVLIIGFYALTITYFLYQRVYLGDINTYLQQEKEFKILLTIPMVGLFLNWFYQQWKWAKALEAKTAKTEIALLKSQINPHFFFNTLNNLYGLAVEKSDDTPKVILQLSDMMRYTIYMGKEEFVLLKDEIDYLKNYIELHKIRYQKKVEITFSHSYESDCQIMPLLLIMPLENAFKHGVESLMNHAFIHVNLIASHEQIIYTIENNFEKQKRKHTEGIGLDNLRQRLQLAYPNRHEISATAEGSTYKFQLKIDTA